MAVITSLRPLSRRSRYSFRLRLSTFLLLVGLVLLLFMYLRLFVLPGIGVPDVEIINGRTVTRRHPELLYKIHNNTRLSTTPLDGILEGHLTLVDIEIVETGLHASLEKPDQIYNGVEATFCHISWDLQDDNPSQYPTFHDLKKGSFLCPGTTIKADFWDIARKAEAYDFQNHTFAATQRRSSQVSVPPTAVLFHESKCGSTVIANALAAFAPHHTRVYADAPAVTKALMACSNNNSNNQFGSTGASCDIDSHIKLIQDIFYILGRVSRPILPQYVFYKLDSIASQSIATFGTAMPHAPWMFAYRDSTEILMSHFHQYQFRQNAPRSHRPVCLHDYGNPEEEQPKLLLELVHALDRTIESLTREEYCAVHVASLAESAIRQHNRTSHQKGGVAALNPGNDNEDVLRHPLHAGPLHAVDQTPHWFINYNELPYRIWESVLPSLLVGVLQRDEMERMHDATRVYSHARGEELGHFKEDSTRKQGRAPASIKDAVAIFLDPVYQKLEAIRQAQQ